MKHWSLRTRFLLFALACLIPFAAVVTWYVERSLDRSIDQIVAYENTMASSVSRSLTSLLAADTDALESIAQLPDVVSLDSEKSEISLGQARNVRSGLSGIFLVNADQNADQPLVSHSGIDPELLMPYIANQLEETVSQGTTTVSQRIPLKNDANVIVLMVPVTTVQSTDTTEATEPGDGDADAFAPATSNTTDQSTKPPGSVIGAIGGVIQIDRIAQTVLPSTRGDAEIAIASPNKILFSTGGIDPTTTSLIDDRSQQITGALEGERTSFTLEDASDTKRTAIALPIAYEPASWAVIVTQPVPGLLDGISRPETIFVFALAVLVIIALAVVLGEITARPLQTLANQTRALHEGRLREPITPLGSGEIRTLSEHFAEMADQINMQLAGLEDNRHDRERQAAQMRDLLRRTNRMQEDERRRIAGEIHDAVSPLITGALYQARALQMTNGATPKEEQASSLRSVTELLERASNELHDVIFDLRPPDLDDLGVVAALEAFMHTIQRTGLSCRLEVSGEPPNLTPEVRLGIYRIVQEALHNVVQHAGADEAVVRLEITDALIRVTIRDNGAGFDPEEAMRPTSLGLLSMQERAESIGATFTIVSKPGGGTAIVFERANSGDVMSDAVLESMMSMSNVASTAPQENGDDETGARPEEARKIDGQPASQV